MIRAIPPAAAAPERKAAGKVQKIGRQPKIPKPAIDNAAIFIVGQATESNLLTPRLVGKRVNLHPVWVIFSLLAFGDLFGLLGLLIAVPVAAILGVLIRFALRKYLASPIYDPAAVTVRDDIAIRP